VAVLENEAAACGGHRNRVWSSDPEMSVSGEEAICAVYRLSAQAIAGCQRWVRLCSIMR
jgi:hypothetical protein